MQLFLDRANLLIIRIGYNPFRGREGEVRITYKQNNFHKINVKLVGLEILRK